MDEKVQKEGVHNTCIACISIASVLNIEKKNYSQVYLEECKLKVKKKKMPGSVDIELESDSYSK